MTWRLAKCISVLQGEVNAKYPNRPKSADGTIGDAAHAATQSDHNPKPPHAGVVTALDITTDPEFTDALSEKLRSMGPHDGRVKYVIFKARITSARNNWQWAPYSGKSAHFDHIHLSVSDSPAEYDRTDHWNVFASAAPTAHHYPGHVLKRGMDEAAVGELNARFNLGHSTHFGDDLNAKVRSFQDQHGLAVDGMVGPATWAAIWR